MQGSLLETRIANKFDMGSSAVFRFSLTADSLLLREPFVSWRDSGDIAVSDARLLNQFGICRTDEGFRVLELTSSAMRLQGDSLRLCFRKY